MNCMKLTWLAMVGAAALLCAATTASSWAASVGPAATQSTIEQANSSLVEAGYRHHGYRRGYHRGGVRFFFAPVIVGGGYYGYDGYDRYRDGYGGEGVSCYRACRDFHGPDFCRYNWRRYC